MKAVAYNIEPVEKEFLAKANQKKHDITLIANPLSLDTVIYAQGKDAVIVFTNDDVSAAVIEKLAALGIQYIVTRSADVEHIDKAAAKRYHIKISNIPSYSSENVTQKALQDVADQTIRNLDLWQQKKCVGDACIDSQHCKTSVAKRKQNQ